VRFSLTLTMLKHFWYACEHSHQVGRTPLSLRLLGQAYVLYRNDQGQVVALADRCAHRGAPLSLGTVEGNCIRCPYHGWRYQATGQCDQIPSNAPGATIPRRVRLTTLPTAEKYDLVWLFVGDPDRAAHTPIPDLLPEQGDPQTWRQLTGSFDWQVHMTRVMEGFIDIAHVTYIHKTSFGSAGMPRVDNADFRTTDVSGSVIFPIQRNTGYRRIPFRRPPDPASSQGTQELTFHLPNLIRLKVAFEDFAIVIFAACVPTDDGHTVMKWLHLRNFLKTPLADGNARKRVERLLTEDSRVLNHLQPKASPLSAGAEFHVSEDAMTIAFRNALRRHLAQEAAEREHAAPFQTAGDAGEN